MLRGGELVEGRSHLGLGGGEDMEDLDPWSRRRKAVVGGSDKGVPGLRVSLCTLAANLCSLPPSPLTVPMETF